MATDPENDPVTYDIVLDNDTSPSIVIATSINETEFTLNSLLQYSNDYYWKVIAKDNNGNSTKVMFLVLPRLIISLQVLSHF